MNAARVTFKNADGSIRVLNWYSNDPRKSALEGKNLNDLLHDWKAESYTVEDYRTKPNRK